jgi:hypothetical protein
VVLSNQKAGSAFAAVGGPSGKEVPLTDQPGKGKGKSAQVPAGKAPAAAPASKDGAKQTGPALPPVFEDEPPAKAPAKDEAGKKKL